MSISSLSLLVCPFLLFLISAICLPYGLIVDEIENHNEESRKEELRSKKEKTAVTRLLEICKTSAKGTAH